VSIEWPFETLPPREVQMEALQAGYGKEGFAYFLRQRLGKTWLAYAEYTILKNEGKVDWCLIFCPNTLKEQWYDNIRTVDMCAPIFIYDSQCKAKFEKWLSKIPASVGGVIIVNYESAKPFMSHNYWERFDTLRTYIIADESTKIKEPTKKMTKACLELASLCAYKRILTGKPRANSNADLWAQLKFINATNRNFHEHKWTFSVMGGFQGRQIVKDINTQKLRDEMLPHCYIAPDKYIEGFTKHYEPMRPVLLLADQRKLYDQMEDELLVELGNGAKITAPIALVKYLRLQQISSGIAGDIDGVQHNTISPDDNPRITLVKELLDDEIDNKCIIVCRFRLSIDNVFNELTRIGYRCAKLVGGMDNIEHIKRDFNFGDTDILIAQTQVLSFGHTLPGNKEKPCDSMIFYENDFSLINRAQCESRPEEFGRNIPISYYDMYASQMDKYIIAKLRDKEDGSMALMNYARKHGIFGGPPPE
jgi:hypothetical protein